jgi:hypothetical protein
VLVILLGSIIGFAMAHELAIVNEREQGDTVVRIAVDEDYQEDLVVNVEPLASKMLCVRHMITHVARLR